MNNRRAIARQAMAAALRTRLSVGYGLDHAVCVYDLAAKLGVEVRFLDLPSMEGMYSSASGPTVIVSSLRPPGRWAFTCAHELGHHNRSDGVEIDELVEQWEKPRIDPKEFAADCFAGALLMPKMAVSRAFAIRGWSMEDCTPEQAFTVAGYFGVGYTTLVHHLRSALQVLPDTREQALLKVSPRKAQSLLLGWQTPQTVVMVDAHWTGRAVDVEVGDLIFIRGGAQSEGGVHGTIVRRGARTTLRGGQARNRVTGGQHHVVCLRPGLATRHVGRAVYRHWGEAEDE